MPPDSSLPWWKHLDRYHWFVFAMASLAWLFDCLDQQLFILAGIRRWPICCQRAGTQRSMVVTLPRSSLRDGHRWADLWCRGRSHRAGSYPHDDGAPLFLVYRAVGIVEGWIDFAAYRFVTGLGVGGVFGLSVALIADALPDQSRSGALGTLQALSAVGNVTAG
jgi:MFS family permease